MIHCLFQLMFKSLSSTKVSRNQRNVLFRDVKNDSSSHLLFQIQSLFLPFAVISITLPLIDDEWFTRYSFQGILPQGWRNI